MIRLLGAIVGFMFGGMVGLLVLAVVPGLLFIFIWYGADASHNPGIILALMRPAAVVGGIIGAVAGTVAAGRI